ncbi:hypothetical protein CC78DRAFT_580793 [Lojkania enalia]|uniref:Uncharacterized protein n=1 Tax=Lojkania enalia TaxID=147567 RepID=A0A9P4K926_9PLEO|nr:hypothetical protein CC78DRAFT_580793 [Didymosphaeria enalia]
MIGIKLSTASDGRRRRRQGPGSVPWVSERTNGRRTLHVVVQGWSAKMVLSPQDWALGRQAFWCCYSEQCSGRRRCAASRGRQPGAAPNPIRSLITIKTTGPIMHQNRRGVPSVQGVLDVQDEIDPGLRIASLGIFRSICRSVEPGRQLSSAVDALDAAAQSVRSWPSLRHDSKPAVSMYCTSCTARYRLAGGSALNGDEATASIKRTGSESRQKGRT